jgi:hypothetical protein
MPVERFPEMKKIVMGTRTAGVSMSIHAVLEFIRGPHPGRECFPYGALTNRRVANTPRPASDCAATRKIKVH